jgi:uncharacterized YigZ family protein
MHCVKSAQRIEDTIKKSRFIGIITPVATEQAALQKLQRMFNQFPDASHIAFAYRIKTERGIVMRLSDAGEPSGTAGKPIYQHLEGKDLVNVLLAVVRYFGGIKLGAGGLVRAYGNSAKNVIAAAEIMAYIEYATLSFTLDYKALQDFNYQLKKLQGEIIQEDFSDHVEVVVRLPEGNVEALQKSLARVRQ